MTKKDKPLYLPAFIIGKLRSASRKWPPFNEAKKRCRVPVRVEYKKGDEWAVAYVLDAHGKETGEVVRIRVYRDLQNRERKMNRCELCGRLFFDYEYLPTKGSKKKPATLKKQAMMALDHIDPVVPVDRDTITWDEYITRLFCDPSNLQNICNYSGERDGQKSCHKIKTENERQQRVAAKVQKN